MLPCFCKHHETKGVDLATQNFEFYNIILKKDMQLPICENWISNTNKANLMKLMTSKSIVLTNVLLKQIIVIIQGMIGCHTETILTKNITTSVFICLFINTGILIMLNSANLKSQNIPILS